uniref:Reverse transcriptase domain-containing protein n=1 Tax=Tanacetum cinerariifolium TaxID=118510 RepID=A0A699GZN0_TANCI|nr:reverse transcriptase domain-containing protein [Tanacetum cinerariifolium]
MSNPEQSAPSQPTEVQPGEKNEKLKELKAQLNFEGCSGTSRYSESKTVSAKEHEKRHRFRRSRSPRPSPSVFSRIRRERSRSPRQRSKERGVFKRMGSRGKSMSARLDSYNQHSHSRYTEALSKSEDSGGNARVWFDDLPPESIDNYEDLKKAFLENYLQQKKYIKDPIELHNIKQQDEESTKDFVRRYKLESRDFKGAPECMRIFGFVHGITNPELIKRLHDKIPKTVDEMMRVTTSFLRGEVAASNHERKKTFPPWKQHESSQKPGVRKLQAVSSTAHEMLKILVEGRVITLKSSKLVPLECAMVSELEKTPSAAKLIIEERVKVAINPKYPEQTVMIGSTLTEEARNKLCGLLQRNLDIFDWKPANMTDVPRHIAKHYLNVWEGCSPVRQKKKGQAADRNQAIQEKVGKLTEAGIMREVHYHDWLSNPVMVKNMMTVGGYAYKGYHEIQMATEYEEKTVFITSQGIFYYTKMPFGLRNAGATYQRLVDKAFHKQIDIWKSEKSLPFFKTLKNARKKSNFYWTTKAKEAFKQMKQLIAELPMLTAPIKQEELIVYLAAAKETVSAVLLTEREAKQMLIYFVSKALRGPELNYTSMEKLILALVHASKHLKRVSVKGHIFADFIVERPKEDSSDTPMEEEKELHEPCILFTDGSSCTDGSGAGLILTNPEGMKFTYALRFRFNATNNEAEYEALIAGLRIAKQMGVKNLQVNVDSHLVANQVSRTYVAKEADMIRYLEKKKGERRRQYVKPKAKQKMEKYYNSKVRNTSFKTGYLVYRNNDASRAKDIGKLGLKWEGPYEVTEALGKGAYKLRVREGK